MPNSILVVDDDPGIRQTLVDLLEEEGYAVDAAGDGLEALERVEAAMPALILLDISMPRMDGFAFADELDARGLRAQTRVVVLTADARAQQKAERVGAEGYAEKPFDIGALLDQIARLLGDAEPA